MPNKIQIGDKWYVAATAATAEEQANANQFDGGGRTLLNVSDRVRNSCPSAPSLRRNSGQL